MPPNDAELLERWRCGDKAAGEMLFERYFAAVERFFVNKAPEHVDDLVQETFLGCLKSRDHLSDSGKFRSHLFAIAYHVLGTHLRKVYLGRKRLDFTEISMHDLAPGPGSLLAHRDEQRLLLEALRKIPVDHQVLLELHYWEALTTEEISAVLGVPVGTVRGRLQRARALLEQAMERLANSPILLESTRDRLDDWVADCRRRLGGFSTTG
jgi:RNA polymerase sigma-70 factor (ECF subfamily)